MKALKPTRVPVPTMSILENHLVTLPQQPIEHADDRQSDTALLPRQHHALPAVRTKGRRTGHPIRGGVRLKRGQDPNIRSGKDRIQVVFSTRSDIPSK